MKKGTFFTVLFTYFVDNLGWSIVFPIFAPLFLDPTNNFFKHDVDIATRTTILGFFLALYPLMQFFSAPVLGEFADRSGRRKALLVSVAFTFLGYVISAISISLHSLVWLFIGRVVTGLFSGNLSVCLATISDMSEDEHVKAKNFGFLSMIVGFSFIIGAYLGGQFSDEKLSSFFSPAVPFWVAAFLSFANLFFIFIFFKETFKVNKEIKFDFLEGVHNIQQALKKGDIKIIFLIYFLFLFSWTIIFQFTPVLVIKRFDFTNSNIGDLAGFMGICWALGSWITNHLLIRYFSQLKILEVVILIFTILCGLIAIPVDKILLLCILGSCVIIGGIAWPLCSSIISNRAPSNIQGKILGISQSMQSLAMGISPIIGGIANGVSIYFPFVIASFSCLIAGIIYFNLRPKEP